MSLNTNRDNDVLDEPLDDVDAITDDNEDNLIYKINLNADNHRLCVAIFDHYAVLGKLDASLAKKLLTATEAPHLDTTSLMAKLDDVAKTIDLHVSTKLANKLKTHFMEQLDHGSEKELHPKIKLPR